MSAPVLLDLAPRLGCVCSGAIAGVPVSQARAAVVALEPPRSPTPVVEQDIHVPVELDMIDEEQRGAVGLADEVPRAARAARMMGDKIEQQKADGRQQEAPTTAARS